MDETTGSRVVSTTGSSEEPGRSESPRRASAAASAPEPDKQTREAWLDATQVELPIGSRGAPVKVKREVVRAALMDYDARKLNFSRQELGEIVAEWLGREA